MNTPSKLLDQGVDAFASLPGIGKKTALRLALHVLGQSKEDVHGFTHVINRMRDEIKFCRQCHNISELDLCEICASPKRNDLKTICVVEDMRDVIALENTQQFGGYYHVLGGNISPMEGIGPNDLHIESLIRRVEEEKPEEVILALSTTMEGDTTNFYLYKKLASFGVKITTIARGVAIGDELEYTDVVTLGRSILNRTLYASTLKR